MFHKKKINLSPSSSEVVQEEKEEKQQYFDI